MDCLILAAGYGNRLRPITECSPKPLLPIIHTPLIEVIITMLKESNPDRIAVNLFYKSDEIKSYLAQFNSAIHVAVEPTLRGTGGALVNFRQLFDRPFVVHSCDVLSHIDIRHLFTIHQASHSMATIALIQRAGTNIFRLTENRITGIADQDEKDAYTYAGVGAFSPRVFDLLPDEETFTIIDVFNSILAAGETIIGIPYTSFWYNINSVYNYWNINRKLLNKEIVLPGIVVGSGTISVHPSSTIKTEQLSGFVLVGRRCTIAEDSALHNTIVFDDTMLQRGSYRNNVVSNTFCIEIDEIDKE